LLLSGYIKKQDKKKKELKELKLGLSSRWDNGKYEVKLEFRGDLGAGGG